MLTPEQREALEEQLSAFAGAEANIRKAMEPVENALSSILIARDAALQAHGVDLHGYCECGKPLLTGDKVHHCDDGPTLCEDCAPTWADIKAQADAPDTEHEPRHRFYSHLWAHLDVGGAITDKVVTVLEGF